MADCYLGEIRLFGGARLPSGWAFCMGQLLDVSEYEELFSLIGSTYGGDGRTTFALPDLRSRVPICCGQGLGLTNRPLTSAGGTETVTLTANQIPNHNHLVAASRDEATSASPSGTVFATTPDGNVFYGLQAFSGSVEQVLNNDTVASAGSSMAHENRMPVLAVNFIIALRGEYPSPGND